MTFCALSRKACHLPQLIGYNARWIPIPIVTVMSAWYVKQIEDSSHVSAQSSAGTMRLHWTACSTKINILVHYDNVPLLSSITQQTEPHDKEYAAHYFAT